MSYAALITAKSRRPTTPIMAQVLEEQQHQPVQHSDKRQFRLYNILVVIAMSLGSMSYGYSASKVTLLEDVLPAL